VCSQLSSCVEEFSICIYKGYLFKTILHSVLYMLHLNARVCNLSRDSIVQSPCPMNVSHDTSSSTCGTTATTTGVKVDTTCTLCTCGAMQAKQEKLLLAAQRKYVMQLSVVNCLSAG